MPTTTRFGKLRITLGGGESDLLNAVARLSVLYEDLRLEMNELNDLYNRVIELREPDQHYRVIYFVRRALATLTEFRRGLTAVRVSCEFKKAQVELSARDSSWIIDADRFLQQHGDQLKALRNEFAGHIEAPGVKFALSHLTDEIGKVTWNSDPNAWTMGLECDFAGYVVTGSIMSKLQSGSDPREELRKTNDVLGQGFVHAQKAMVALIHAFLWDKFGR